MRRCAIVGGNWIGADGQSSGTGGRWVWTDTDGDGVLDYDPAHPNDGEVRWDLPEGVYCGFAMYSPGMFADAGGNLWIANMNNDVVRLPLFRPAGQTELLHRAPDAPTTQIA